MESSTPPGGDLNVGDVDADRDAIITYNVYNQPLTPSPHPPPFAGVPALPAHIVGRQAQLEALVARLVSGAALSLTALAGMGGVGKTTLAVALAYDARVRAHFPDGVLWASLGKQGAALTAQAAWGDALGCDVTGHPSEAARCQVLRDTIGQRRMLLVIDDAWTPQAAEWLRCGGPACAHLLTTRDGDLAHAFADAGQVVTVRVLTNEQGWELLQTLAPAACAADPDAARALAHAVGGLPLALRLVGGYLAPKARSLFPELTMAALAAVRDPAHRLGLAMERLGTQDGRAVPLDEVIALSLEELPEEGTRAFYALAAFAPKPATFDRAAAEAVTETDAVTLAHFVARHLVEWDGTRFALHPILHDFARVRCDPDATMRHRAHYLALANANREDWQRIEVAYAQLQWAWAQLPDVAVLDYVWALRHHQRIRGLWQDYITWATRGLTVARQQGQRRDEAVLLNNIGLVYDNLGQRREALGYYERALPIREEVGDRAGLAATLNNIGAVYDALGQRREALGYFERALPIQEEVGDRAGLAATLNNMGMVYDNLGQRREALGYYERALPIREEVGDHAGLAVTLNNIGLVYDNLGQLQKALGYYERALPIREEVGDRAGLAATLNNIGAVYDALGQRREALGYFERALPITEEVGDRYQESITRYNLAMLHRAEGRLAEAVAQLRLVVALDEQVEHSDLEPDRATLAKVEAELKAEGEKGREGEGERGRKGEGKIRQPQEEKKRPWWRRWLGH